MPEVELQVRWADGTVQCGRSPSRAIERWLVEGGVYPRDELVRRAERGLAEASDRVRERYGHTCSVAARLADRLRLGASCHGRSATAPARVQRLAQCPPRLGYRPPDRLPDRVEVAVIGGGQAGLSASWYLGRRGIEHVVLERDRVASTWRHQRWDSFSLVTPNWQCRLPGHPYAGDDPDGFMVREQIIEYVQSFAASFDPPLHEGATVHAVRRETSPGGGFVLRTDHGELRCEQVVLAVGGYHEPALPEVSAALPGALTQLHSSQYRNPSSLPDGAVLVVGTGQSGAQIAEDLHLAGRQVHVSVGSAPRVARFYRGRDCVAWLEDIGHYDMPITEHPEGLAARREPNHYVTGRDGGHDIDLRAYAREGMRLHGRLSAVDGARLRVRDDLVQNLDGADATLERIKDTIDRWIAEQGIAAPREARYEAVWAPPDDGGGTLDLEAAGISTVVWATGFRSRWDWVQVAGLLEDGYPTHERGITTVDGLYVLGLPWLHTWGSGRFAGVARDAEHVVARIAERARVSAPRRAA